MHKPIKKSTEGYAVSDAFALYVDGSFNFHYQASHNLQLMIVNYLNQIHNLTNKISDVSMLNVW